MFNKLLNRIAANIGWIVGLLVLALNIIFMVDIRDLSEVVTIKVQNFGIVAIMILNIIVLGWILGKINRKFDKKFKYLILVLFIIGYALTSILWIKYIKLSPAADSKYICDIAKKLYDGKIKDFRDETYLGKCPHQVGMVYILTGIHAIFHTDINITMQYLNLVFNLGTIIILFIIAKKFLKEYKFNETFYWWISLTFIPLILLNTYVYGDYIGLFFATLAIFLIMKYTEKNNFAYGILSGLTMGISIIAKKNFLVMLLAIAVYLCLDLIKQKRKIFGYVGKFLAMIIILGLAYMPQKMMIDYAYNDMKMQKDIEIPTSAYIYMGMNKESTRCYGWYGGFMPDPFGDKTKTEVASIPYKEKIKTRVKEIFSNPVSFFEFYNKKNTSMWADGTYQSIWYNYPLYAETYDKAEHLIYDCKLKESFYIGKISDSIMYYQKVLVIAMFIGFIVTLFTYRKNISNEALLLVIIFLGGFFFHMIWEAKSRYVLPYVIMTLPISVIGLTKIYNKIYTKLEILKIKRKQKNEPIAQKWDVESKR